VLDLAAAGKVRCRVEAQPLARINSVLDQMHKGAITGRVVLTPGTSRL
jgi:alcohol dehydrogenase, propanol-preferring